MSWDLVADIGGTNARFACVEDNKIAQPKSYPTKGDHGLLDAMADYIKNVGTNPDTVVLAAAGMIKGGWVKLTNADQDISIAEVQKLTGSKDIRFINDFEAAAWALATVTKDDTVVLQGPPNVPLGNRLVVGPGTGLGVGTLIHSNGQYTAVPGEGGHVGISPQNFHDVEVFKAFRHIWPETRMSNDSLRFEAEAFLSGTGLPFLYKAVCMVQGTECNLHNARDVLAAANETHDAAAVRTASMFRTYLGMVAGDLALTISAKGGIFLVGGVILQNTWLLDQTFLDGYNAGGRFTQARKDMPVYLYQNSQFGLIGAANALRFT